MLINLLISHNPGCSPLSSFNPPAIRDEPKQVWCQRQRQPAFGVISEESPITLVHIQGVY